MALRVVPLPALEVAHLDAVLRAGAAQVVGLARGPVREGERLERAQPLEVALVEQVRGADPHAVRRWRKKERKKKVSFSDSHSDFECWQRRSSALRVL